MIEIDPVAAATPKRCLAEKPESIDLARSAKTRLALELIIFIICAHLVEKKIADQDSV